MARPRKTTGLRLSCALTVDLVLFVRAPGGKYSVLLIERGKPPYKGKWALPGGFVDEGERSVDAARRELLEETGVRAGRLYYVGSFSDPGRDPRGRTVSEAFAALASASRVRPRAGDDAAAARLFPLGKLPPLAFDHAEIIQKARALLRREGRLP